MNGAMYKAFGWVFLCGCVEIFTLTLLRLGGWRNYVSASLLFSFGVVPLLLKALEYEGIGLVNFMLNVFTTLAMFGIGIYMFNEKINNLQIIGVILSIIGLALILESPDA